MSLIGFCTVFHQPLPVRCTPGVDEDGEEDPALIICDLGNPLPATAKVSAMGIIGGSIEQIHCFSLEPVTKRLLHCFN